MFVEAFKQNPLEISDKVGVYPACLVLLPQLEIE